MHASVAEIRDSLTVGVVRDTAGYAVADASLIFVDGNGIVLRRLQSASDGTFAFTATSLPVRVRITCEYCSASEQAFPASHVLEVTRYRHLLEQGPSPSDIAALPTRSLAQLEALEPFSIKNGATVSDRGLMRGADATVLDGVGLYRASDNASLSKLIPGANAARISPSANAYAIESTSDESPPMRAASTGALSLRDIGNTRLTLNRDPMTNTIALTAGTTIDTTSAIRFSGNVLSASGPAGNVSGAMLHVNEILRSHTLSATVAGVQSRSTGASEGDTNFDFHISSSHPGALSAGIRGLQMHAAADSPESGARQTETIYLTESSHIGRLQFHAGISADPLLRYEGGADRAFSDAVSIAVNYREYPQTTPLYNGDPQPRANLLEMRINASDHRRLNTSAMMYRERTADYDHSGVAGNGMSFAYQLAPRIALQAWYLHAFSSAYETSAEEYARSFSSAQRRDEGMLWLSYENAIRIDMIYRSGRPEISTAIRCGPHGVCIAGYHVLDYRHELTLEYALR
jgi:hypothetical protein